MSNNFKLSKRSLKNLRGVDENLIKVVKYAISISEVDFGVICGLRSLEEQRLLFKSGASETMNSKHLIGRAVDLMAYVGSRGSWELNLYDNIADAMAESARHFNVKIKWGAAWSVEDIASFDGHMQDATDGYIKERYAQNRRPFIDGPHFEIA